mmetsp:Transcript_66195/g.123577  ORF Transcript_66195/g.123577 Transcript_66195/m.123577 type:complete len:804 (-) Transcript_66195:79-2490(-)
MPKPQTPEAPVVSEAGPGSFRISWKLPEADPEIVACTVKMRIVGSQKYLNFDNATGRLVPKGGSVVQGPTSEVTVEGCEDGLAYEAIVAASNNDGWSEVSPSSAPCCVGEARPRAVPPSPLPPRLVSAGPGKLKVTWVLPQACPPVEVSQVEVSTESGDGKWLIDAGSGKLVTSGGRTTFAAPKCEANIAGAVEGTTYIARVCCRNAEGFGEQSEASDTCEVKADAPVEQSSMAFVLSFGPTPQAPTLVPDAEGRMKVVWDLPDEATSSTVKLRRVGDNNWRLVGGKAITAPTNEVIAAGCEDGIEYEAIVNFLIDGRWTSDSPVSKPACIGEVMLPGSPGLPKDPELYAPDHTKLRVRWQIPTAVPPVSNITVKIRPLGTKLWSLVTPAGEITEMTADTISAPTTELDILNPQHGVRYQVVVQMRNKLGQGPESGPSDPACVGRPIQKLMKCMYCFNDFDLEHCDYHKSPETFVCPLCRMRTLDPFHQPIEPYGLLAYGVVCRPVIKFDLELPELKAWRRDDHSVWMRMVKVDSDSSVQVWPHQLTLEANGHEVMTIKPPEEGHVRRDVPKNISGGLKPGTNSIVIRMQDEWVYGFAFALVRTVPRTVQQMAADIPVCPEEEARERFVTLLNDRADIGEGMDEDDEISCVLSNKLKLRCPLSFERVGIPVRGEHCRHLQCFGLIAYLESNLKMRALNNRWTCPVCGQILKPREIRIDGYVEKVLADTSPNVEEVLILPDGSFREIVESEVGPRPPGAASAPASAPAETNGAVKDPATQPPPAKRQRRKRTLAVPEEDSPPSE